MCQDDDDPFGSYGLHPITLQDKPAFDEFFSFCHTRLSDYTFANTFIWRQSIHLHWKILQGCLCVFANGDGGLTMLFPPLGIADRAGALRQALEICESYNANAHLTDWTRVEYVSEDLLEELKGSFTAEPMSGDYIYATARMADLAGSDLASKRQARNRFERRYHAATEPFGAKHLPQCLELLALWQEQRGQQEPARSIIQIKQCKETAAAADALEHAAALGLEGMVLHADGKLIGFTLGEMLNANTCSIVIEKTDRNYVGSAQYIFNEFCRKNWSHTTWCNVGDDWEVPSLAWTKQSYRPAMRVPKWVLRPVPVVSLAVLPVTTQQPPAAQAQPQTTLAGPADLDEILALEHKCFTQDVAMSRRQIRYLLSSPNTSVHILRQEGHVVAAALMLKRRGPAGLTGRLYSMAVDSSCRGKGIGRMLLNSCLDVMKRMGATGINLEVDISNTAAINLYASSGFVTTRRLCDYYAPGKDAWKMHLDLHKPPAKLPFSEYAGYAERSSDLKSRAK